MKRFLIIIILLSVLASPMAFAIGADAPSNATPTSPPTGGNTSLTTAQRVVRDRIVVREVPAPHPKVVNGHHTGVGHEPVYKEIKSWNPSACSYVDARDKKLSGEIRNELSTEKAERLNADSAISKRVTTLEEKKDKIHPGIFVLALAGIVFLAGLARQQEN